MITFLIMSRRAVHIRSDLPDHALARAPEKSEKFTNGSTFSPERVSSVFEPAAHQICFPMVCELKKSIHAVGIVLVYPFPSALCLSVVMGFTDIYPNTALQQLIVDGLGFVFSDQDAI